HSCNSRHRSLSHTLAEAVQGQGATTWPAGLRRGVTAWFRTRAPCQRPGDRPAGRVRRPGEGLLVLLHVHAAPCSGIDHGPAATVSVEVRRWTKGSARSGPVRTWGGTL